MNAFTAYLRYLLAKYRRTGLIWTAAFGLYVWMMAWGFSAFQNTGVDTDSFPEALRTAFQIGDIAVGASYLQMEIFSYAPLVVAFFPIMAFAGAIAGEEERGALDIYLAQPLSRATMLLAHVVAVAVWLLVILGTAGLILLAMSPIANLDLPLSRAFAGPLNVFPIAMAAGGVALLLSARMRQKGAAIGGAFAMLFYMYLMDIIGKLVESMAWIRWLSFFRGYGTAITHGFPWAGAAALLSIAAACVALAIPVFTRRDIYT